MHCQSVKNAKSGLTLPQGLPAASGRRIHEKDLGKRQEWEMEGVFNKRSMRSVGTWKKVFHKKWVSGAGAKPAMSQKVVEAAKSKQTLCVAGE